MTGLPGRGDVDLLLLCESSIKPISIASCFLDVLRRCRFPRPNSGGAMDGGGVGEVQEGDFVACPAGCEESGSGSSERAS